jgi:Septum formation initiator
VSALTKECTIGPSLQPVTATVNHSPRVDGEPAYRRLLSTLSIGWYKVGLAVIAAVAVLYAVNFVNEVRHTRELGAQVAAIRAQQAAMNQRNKKLSKAIAWYKTMSFARQQARAWGYVRSGDRPVIVSVHYLKPRPRVIHHTKPLPPAPAWQQWWHAFFGTTEMPPYR